MKILTTTHKTVKFLGFKVIDIWEDYFERRIIVKPYFTDNEINTTEFNIDDTDNN